MHYQKITHLFCALSLLITGAATAQESINARYGINFGSPKDWSREQPFLNVMKLARAWISQDSQTWDNHQPLDIDEHGYVTRLAPGQWAIVFPAGSMYFCMRAKERSNGNRTAL
jgi:hypothetical protein